MHVRLESLRPCDAVLVAAALSALLVYSGAAPVCRKGGFYSAVPQDSVRRLEGRLVSSPVRGSGGRYSAVFAPECAGGVIGGAELRSAAGGTLRVSLLASDVEAHYPGRLFTEHGSSSMSAGALYESGGRFALEGRLRADRGGTPVFHADNAEFRGFGGRVQDRIAAFRARARLHFKRLMYRWGSAGGLVLALLSGSREYLSPELAAAFRLAGLSHLLALSGMHLSCFGSAARRFGAAAQLSVAVAFVWFAGASPSLFRALLCALLGMAARMLFVRSARQVNVLAVSFLIHLFAFPQDVRSAAFILSYTSSLGIALAGGRLLRIAVRFLPRSLATPVATSLAAQIFAAPVSLAFFGAMSPVALFACVVVSPLIALFMKSGLVAVLLCLMFPAMCVPLGFVMGAQYALIDSLVSLFAAAPQIVLWRSGG